MTEEPTNTEISMASPAVLMLSLEKEQQSLEANTSGFLYLASLTDFPDHSLCTFFLANLNERTKARLPV